MDDSIPQKRCTVCRNDFPATPQFFPRNRNMKSGLYPQCKVCHGKKVKANISRPGIREHIYAHQRAYRRRPETQEHLRIYHSRPEIQERTRVNNHTRSSRKMAIQGTHTPQQIQDLLKRQKHKCYYCATTFEKRNGKYVYHVDHTFPIKRVAGTDIPANDISYLVLACPSCNQSKGDKFPWEWPEGGRLL